MRASLVELPRVGEARGEHGPGRDESHWVAARAALEFHECRKRGGWTLACRDDARAEDERPPIHHGTAVHARGRREHFVPPARAPLEAALHGQEVRESGLFVTMPLSVIE